MAASLKVGGYQCKFIDEVPDDLLCQSCRHVARKPHLTSCCGNHFCHTCIIGSQVQQDKKPCPTCQELQFTVLLNKGLQKKILGLHVHCMMEDRGCQWNGKLEHLNAHLNVNTGDCQCVDVECPEKCGQQVQKHQLATHIANECPKRDFTCMHCGFKATYEVVSEKHWPECQNYPVPCPNRCQIGAVERNTLEDHLNMCRLQVIACDFSYAGCNEKLQRQDMEKHVEENTQKHLALMASASMKMKQEFKQKLQEQEDEIREYLEQKERETAEQLKQKDEQIKAVEERLQQSVRKREEQIESMRKTLQKEQKEGEQQLQQQLQQKERQINHIQEKLQEQEQKDNKVQGELCEKQQQIEALKEQIIQVKQVHEKRIKAVEQRRDKQIKSQQDEIREYLEQKERETAEQLKQKDEQIKAVEERLQQLVREKEEQIESKRKTLQKEQKEGEQQLQQQLEQKGRQINHIQEKLQEQEHKLQEKDDEVQGELREEQQQIEALKEQIVQVKQVHEKRIKAVEQQRDKQIKSLEVQSEQHGERLVMLEKQLELKESFKTKLGVLPFHLTMSRFALIKYDMRTWYSPYMYTHNSGYKFQIITNPNWNPISWLCNECYVSVGLYSMSGEFDATLQWPANVTITLQLLNQHRDQDHITVTKQFQWKKPERESVWVDWFTEKLIAHTNLELNAQKQTQYLKDNCLHFCIPKIEVHN